MFCQALRKLKSVCVRVSMGPCIIEACTIAVVSHFLMGLPWVWGFILGYVTKASLYVSTSSVLHYYNI